MLSVSFMNLPLEHILLHLSAASPLVRADATADSLEYSRLHSVGLDFWFYLVYHFFRIHSLNSLIVYLSFIGPKNQISEAWWCFMIVRMKDSKQEGSCHRRSHTLEGIFWSESGLFLFSISPSTVWKQQTEVIYPIFYHRFSWITKPIKPMWPNKKKLHQRALNFWPNAKTFLWRNTNNHPPKTESSSGSLFKFWRNPKVDNCAVDFLKCEVRCHSIYFTTKFSRCYPPLLLRPGVNLWNHMSPNSVSAGGISLLHSV